MTKALETIRNDSGVYMHRAYCFLEERKPNEAITDCCAALKKDPSSAYAYYYRSQAYNLKGDFEEAVRDMKKAEELGFIPNPEYKKQLYWRMQNIEKELQGNPNFNNPEIKEYYKKIRGKIYSRAYDYFKKNKPGEIVVSFSISKEGRLRGARLVRERTHASWELRRIAIRAVKDSSPFEEFTQSLQHCHDLKFNIVISFSIEQ